MLEASQSRLTQARGAVLMAQANGSLRNRFAKRHYEAIATAIQEARRRASDGDNNHDYSITNVVDELCWLFRTASLVEIVSIGLVFLERM
jgi:hypothetical protein